MINLHPNSPTLQTQQQEKTRRLHPGYTDGSPRIVSAQNSSSISSNSHSQQERKNNIDPVKSPNTTQEPVSIPSHCKFKSRISHNENITYLQKNPTPYILPPSYPQRH